MKKGVLLVLFAAIVSILVYSYPGGAAADAGRDATNAEGNQGGCGGGGCHSAGTNNLTVELDSAGTAVTSYHGGVAYTVKISASNTSSNNFAGFGFQLVVVKAAGAGTASALNVGTWGALGTSTQNTTAANSGLNIDIVEQSARITRTSGSGTNGSTYVKSIPWTAPAAGTGSVVIYGALNEVTNQSPSSYQSATPVTITEAVAVAPAASVSISETSGGTTICQGSSITFTATPTNGGTAPTYQWYNGSTAISGATTSTYTTTTLAAGSDVIKCVMTSNLSGVTGSPATSNTITITVNATVTPSVSITSTATSICTGQSVTFTATPTNGGTSPTYQWYNGSTAISGATASTYTTTTLSGSPSITVKLTSNVSCPSTATVTSNAITVTVGSSVTPAVSITSSAGSSLCSGQSTTFTATATNGGTSPTYQWYKNGTAISGATSSTYTSSSLANNDAITCGITSNSSCASPTTATSSAITITITSNATPTVSIVSNTGSAICNGQSVTFTATPTNGGSAPTYQWYSGNTAITGATSSTYNSTTLTNNEVVSCKIVSNSACVSTSNATSNSITMTVTSAAAPAVTITSNGGSSICAGQNVTFIAASTNGGSAPTYQWYNGSSSISGATASTYSSSSLVNGASITVVLTSNMACASPTTATSNAITITVSSSTTASVTATSSVGTSVCSGQGATLTASPVNGGSAPQYQWMLNGSNISGATSSTYAASSIANNSIYTVQMISNSSCVSQSTVVSSPLTFSVVAGGAAAVSVTHTGSLTICPGTSITFSANAINGGTSPVYQWTKNGSNVGSNSNTYTDNALANGDVINCSVSSSLSCASPSTAVSNSLTAIVYNVTPATITDSNNVLSTVPGGTYQWYVNNISVTNGTHQTLVPNANGSYTVEVTDINGCQSTSAPYTVTSVGIIDPVSLSGVTVYPNPVDNNLFIDFKNVDVEGRITARLIDMNGRVLIENILAPASGEKISLDMTQIQDGVYLLQINENDANAYRKVVVGR